jgi:hypothetical protein
MRAALLLTLLSLPAAVRADAGPEAAAFLKIDAGARAAALGGAFVAVADDASSIFYNPAGPALMTRAQAYLSHTDWIEGLKTEHLAYVHPASDKIAFFGGVAALSSPMMVSYDAGGNETGAFNASDMMIGAGFAYTEDTGARAGLMVKRVSQEAREHSDSAYAADLGAILERGGFRFGAAVQNIGDKITLHKESFALPRTLRAGAAYKALGIFWLTAELRKQGRSDIGAAAGLEAGFGVAEGYKTALRAGYATGRDENTGSGFSGGLGLSVSDFTFDYAFSPFGELGGTHRLALSVKFGEERDIEYRTYRWRSPRW